MLIRRQMYAINIVAAQATTELYSERKDFGYFCVDSRDV